MELEVSAVLSKLESCIESCVERLTAAAGSMEGAAAKWKQSAEGREGEVGKITAAVEPEARTTRELELERRLAEAEAALAGLRASAAPAENRMAARKTLPAATVQLLAKGGIDAGESVDLKSLDAALAGMSVEHRIAVKSQLMRTGALTV